jgi:hypothetical protein
MSVSFHKDSVDAWAAAGSAAGFAACTGGVSARSAANQIVFRVRMKVLDELDGGQPEAVAVERAVAVLAAERVGKAASLGFCLELEWSR